MGLMAHERMPRARHQSAQRPSPFPRSMTSASRGGSGNSPIAAGFRNDLAAPGTTTAALPSPQTSHPMSAADLSRIVVTRISSGEHSRLASAPRRAASPVVTSGAYGAAVTMTSRGPPQPSLAARSLLPLQLPITFAPDQSGQLHLYDKLSPGLTSSGKVTDGPNSPLTLQQKTLSSLLAESAVWANVPLRDRRRRR